MRLRVSLRSTLVAIAFIALLGALLRERYADKEPVYLHVFGTITERGHDDYYVDSPVVSRDDWPWTRIATVHVYDRRPFGFHTPNNRMPAIRILGCLSRGLDARYYGHISWLLDDSNLTYEFAETVSLDLDTIVYIDESYDLYLISRNEDPYEALIGALNEDDPFATLADNHRAHAEARWIGFTNGLSTHGPR